MGNDVAGVSSAPGRLAVILPYRSDGSRERERNYRAIWRRWASERVSVATGRGTEGKWCKAAAVWDAVECTDAEWLVVSDADVWCDGVLEAIDGAVRSKRPWAIPHGTVYRLNDPSSEVWCELGRMRTPTFDRWPYEGRPGGGIVCIRRKDYLRVPMDPRFLGWGQEDDAWSVALHSLLGRPFRGRHALVHLWHPPQDKMNDHAGSQESLDLYARYRACRKDPRAMRVLVDEGRRLLSG